MNLKMVRLQLIAFKSDLQPVICILRGLGCVHIDDINNAPDVQVRPLAIGSEVLQAQEKNRLVLTQIEGLLETLGGATAYSPENTGTIAQDGIAELHPLVQRLTARRVELQAELDSLPRYQATLNKLLPVVPPMAREPGYTTVGILVNRAHTKALDIIGKRVIELTGGHADTVGRDLDDATRAMLLIFPVEFASEVDALLGNEDISRLRLPAALGEGSPDAVMGALRQRLAAIPTEIKAIGHELEILAEKWREKLTGWRDSLRDELETYRLMSSIGETDTSFVMIGWVPARDFERVKSALHAEIGERVLVHTLPLTPELKPRVPVAMENPRLVRPFQSLVKLQSLPRYDGIDPSMLMALFLPFFFGMMLGDIGYGALLLVITLVLVRRFKAGMLRDILSALVIGSVWSIVFGFVFGEFFGTLGEHLGLHALLFDRASPEHVTSLLLMTIAVGAAHVTLGVILGFWDALMHRNKSHALERGGMLMGLVALFMLVGVLAGFLPKALMTPAVSGVILGIVLLSASMGWLGILLGPIEFIGVIGNMMSYLRIAAIGLASVYLAKVANDMAGVVGNLVVGIIIAVLIHALNLALGAFSPTIHSLRLHYVEFFRKFYEGGGRPYEPFRSQFASHQ